MGAVRTLRRRHASNGSNTTETAEPARKRRARFSSGEGRSTRSTSGDVLERSRHSSDDESIPSNLSTPRMSPRSRSPVKAVAGESVVVNLPKKKKKKDSFEGKARAEA